MAQKHSGKYRVRPNPFAHDPKAVAPGPNSSLRLRQLSWRRRMGINIAQSAIDRHPQSHTGRTGVAAHQRQHAHGMPAHGRASQAPALQIVSY